MATHLSILKDILNLKRCTIKSYEKVTKERRLNKRPFEQKQLLIQIKPTKHAELRCPYCERKCPRYDHKYEGESHWRASNIDGMPVYLCYRPNRICCPEHGVQTEYIPWADGSSRFTEDFNNDVAWMAGQTSKTTVSEYFDIHWETVGNCIKAAKDRLEPDVSVRLHGLRRICVDETSYKKGYAYITVVYDMDKNQVVWVQKCHGKSVFSEFCELLSVEERNQIEIVAGDGAKWIDECVKEYFPNAVRCVDFFHTVEWANESLDKVRVQTAAKATRRYNTAKDDFRKAEQEAYLAEQQLIERIREARLELDAMPKKGRPSAKKLELLAFIEGSEQKLAENASSNQPKAVGRPKKDQFTPEHQAVLDVLDKKVKDLKGAKLALGHDPNKCTARQTEIIALIQNDDPDLYKAYQIKEKYRIITHMKDKEAATLALDDWIEQTLSCEITPMVQFAEKIQRHRDNIINAISTGTNSAKSEAVNTQIKVLIRMARGFRNLDNLIALVYLKCSDLVIPLNNRPQLTSEERAQLRNIANQRRKEQKNRMQCASSAFVI